MATFTASVVIAAPPAPVWSLLADVERWPEWTPTVTRVTPAGSAALARGARFTLLQPKLRPAEWTVTELEPGVAFTWTSSAPGVLSTATHRLTPTPEGHTRLDLHLHFTGPLGWLVAALAGSLTRSYLAQEAAGLKGRAEAAAAPLDAPAAPT